MLNLFDRGHSIQRLLVLLLILFPLFLFSHTLQYPFIWDDDYQIVNNGTLRSFKFLPEVLFSSTFDSGQGNLIGSFYRPLDSLMYFISYQLWHLNPFGYHLIQVSLHIVNTILLFSILCLVLKKYFRNSLQLLIPFGIALIFSIHPVTIESVVYIGSIGEVLYTTFALVGIHFLLSRIRSGDVSPTSIKTLALFFFCLFCALLSKESAITTFLISYLIIKFHIDKLPPKFARHYIIGSAITITFYSAIRFGIAKVPIISDYGTRISQAPLFARILTLPYILARYISLLIFPIEQQIYDTTVIESIYDPKLLISLLILVVSLVFIIFFCFRRVQKRITITFLSIFIIALIPVLNIYGIDMTAADRWLYFPQIGFWVVVITSLASFANNKQKLLFTFCCLFSILTIYYVIRMQLRSFDWQSPLSLYSHDVQLNSTNNDLLGSYAVALMNSGHPAEALPFMIRAVELNPHWFITQTNLGVIYQRLGMNDEAEKKYLYIITHGEGNPFAYANLIVLYINENKLELAQSTLAEAFQKYPNFNRLRVLEIYLKYKQGDKEAALRELQVLLKGVVIPRDIEDFQQQMDRYISTPINAG